MKEEIEKLFEGIVFTNLERIDGEEDLKLGSGININVPPPDGRCQCCRRHINELRPFGKTGDPLVEDFDGALLVKTFRRHSLPPDKKTKQLYNRFFGDCVTEDDYDIAMKLLVHEYGENDAKIIELRVQEHGSVGKSWECRDCIILDQFEYFEKLGWDLDEYYTWKPRPKMEKGSQTRR